MLVYVGHLFVSCWLFGDVGHISKHVSNLFYGRQVLLKDYVLFQPGTSSMQRPTKATLDIHVALGELQKRNKHR